MTTAYQDLRACGLRGRRQPVARAGAMISVWFSFKKSRATGVRLRKPTCADRPYWALAQGRADERRRNEAAF